MLEASLAGFVVDVFGATLDCFVGVIVWKVARKKYNINEKRKVRHINQEKNINDGRCGKKTEAGQQYTKNAIFVMNPVARVLFAGAPPSHKPAAARWWR